MEVWQAIRKDAESGAKQLVSEYGDRLFAAAVVLCRNDHQAEDLVFRTFDQAVRKIGQYRPSGDFYNWLYTILLNFLRMDARKKRPGLVYVGAPVDLPPIESEAPVESVSRTSDEDVRRALDALPAPTREVVMLKYFQDMPVERIARLLDIPEGTVKSRLFQARKLLYAALSAGGETIPREGGNP